MKSIAALVFILILLLGDCKNEAEKEVIMGCRDFCCKNASNINLTKAFNKCCKETEKCLLPKKFYNVSCSLKIIDSCLGNQTNTSAIKQIQTDCCGDVSCNENNFATQSKKCTKRFEINVKWEKVNFEAKYDLVERKWKKKEWSFFLKMVSQKCLDNSTVRRRPDEITYTYPYYTANDRGRTEIMFSYESPPAYLVDEKESFTMFTVVGSSFNRMWATLLLCVIWSLISGVIIWILDHRANQHQFPLSFWEGVREGAWWAMVTMTSVGYGDKTPKSLPARIYSAVWMIAGMIILSIFTAEVTSGLTSKELMRHHTHLGKKVGVPFYSKRFFEDELRGAKIKEIQRNSNESFIKHLQNKTCGIEKIVLHGCEEFDDDTYEKFQFVRALTKPYVGISAKEASSFEISCVKKMAKEHLGEFFEEVPECEENSKIDMTEYGSRKGLDHRDVTTIIMYVSTGLLVLMFLAGCVWDLKKTRNRPRKKEGNVGDHGSVEMNATEEEREIRVIKEDKDVRGSLKAASTTEV